MYRLEVSPAADRDLDKLKDRIRRQDFERLRDAVLGLAEQPRPYGVSKIKGTDKAYRIRVGSFRIVYEIYDDDKLVLVLQIVRRNETTYHY